MSREEEEQDGHAEQEFLGGCVLVTVVNLLPHVEVVVGPGVEVEGYAAHPVEHDVGASHVGDVGHGPRRLLRHARDRVEDYLQAEDYYDVDGPCSCLGRECFILLKRLLVLCPRTFRIHPICIEIR